MRIIIVDDSEDSRELAEAALLSAGYEGVATAGSAQEAFEILGISKRHNGASATFDLVLLDIVMPEIDGIEACARIRSDHHYADVPVIMVTSLADVDSLANAFVAGATDYITKPLNRIELLARVRSALKLKAELDRRQAREHELLAFLSTWSDRRASSWVDEATGLLAGEVAEAYLAGVRKHRADQMISVLAVAIDRLEIYRLAQGEEAARSILGKVANVVRSAVASVGTIAAAYRNGIIILVLPDYSAGAAREIGERLRVAVSNLRIANPETISSDHVTASVVAVTGTGRGGVERANLLSRALSAIKGATRSGSNRLVVDA